MSSDATARLSPVIQSVLNGLMAYEPERVILFGSAARGDADERSDIDLIVVKNTEERFVQRLVSVGALVPPGISADVFVYTPQELDAMMAEGNPFIAEALRDGKVLYEKTPGDRATVAR